MFSPKALLSLVLVSSTLAAPVARRNDFGSVNIRTCFNDLFHTEQAVHNACAAGSSGVSAARAACASASGVVLASIGSCGATTAAPALESSVSSANGITCASAMNNATFTVETGCASPQGPPAPLVQSAGCAKALETVAVLVADACPASPTATSNVAGTLSSAAAIGSAAAAVQDATTRTAEDDVEGVLATPSAQNCGLALSSEQFELQLACTIKTNITEFATAAQAACANSTALILGRITPPCGAVADAQTSQPAAFAVGVSQASGGSCTSAAANASSLMNTVCAPAGGNIFSKLVESPACDGAKATALGLVSTACPTNATAPAVI